MRGSREATWGSWLSVVGTWRLWDDVKRIIRREISSFPKCVMPRQREIERERIIDIETTFTQQQHSEHANLTC